jgi:cytochrome c oxidase assembly protein subunit 15
VAPAAAGLRRVAGLIIAVVFLQIFLGGLVAGLNAGLTFNTWPLMDGALVPSGLFIQEPAWRNVFENVATVQFDHRLVAYCLFALTVAHALQARGTPHARRAAFLALLVTLQATLGITTLLLVVPLHLALAHQFGAVIVLGAAVLHLRAMGRPIAAVGAGTPLPAAGRAS